MFTALSDCLRSRTEVVVIWISFNRMAFCSRGKLKKGKEVVAVGLFAGIGVCPQKLWSSGLPAACIQHDFITPGGHQLSCSHHALHSPARCQIPPTFPFYSVQSCLSSLAPFLPPPKPYCEESASILNWQTPHGLGFFLLMHANGREGEGGC